MSTGDRYDKFMKALLILLVISVTGTLLTCARPEVRTGAVVCGAQAAVPGEPVLGVSYANETNEADPHAGYAAMRTVQSCLMTLHKENEQRRSTLEYSTVLLLCVVAVLGLFVSHELRHNLSCPIPRWQTIIIYIHSQDGPKA